MAKPQPDLQTEEAIESEDSDCAHFWNIESPNGPTSIGSCKVCGAIREFRNSIPGSAWDRGQGEARKRANALRQARSKGKQVAAGGRPPSR